MTNGMVYLAGPRLNFLGAYTGPPTSMDITAQSPGVIVRILGWVLLFLPVICVLNIYVET